MSVAEVKSMVASKIESNSHYSGSSFGVLCLGVGPEHRGNVALALLELINEGRIEMNEARVFDNVGNASTETRYRKRFA